MAQIFRQRSNTLARVSFLLVPLVIAGTAWAWYIASSSRFVARVNVPREQPVPFSHKHHACGLGIDFRSCHASVEKSVFAGLPSNETCLSCHSQVRKDAPLLAQVRESLHAPHVVAAMRVEPHTSPAML